MCMSERDRDIYSNKPCFFPWIPAEDVKQHNLFSSLCIAVCVCVRDRERECVSMCEGARQRFYSNKP